MTVLTGIICQDVIILAADSLITDSATGAKSYVDKISGVDFVVDQILIAQAGLAPITNRVVEKVRQKARGTKITSASIVTDIIEDSIRETKAILDQDQKSIGSQWGASLLVAFYAEGKPHLCTFEIFGSGVATPAIGHFATAGVGATLASYLLSEFITEHPLGGYAIAALVFVIKKVKDNNAYCGGDTTVKFLAPVSSSNWETQYIGKIQKIPKDYVAMLESHLVALDEKTKNNRTKQIVSILQREGAKFNRKKLAKVKAELLSEAMAERRVGIERKKTMAKLQAGT